MPTNFGPIIFSETAKLRQLKKLLATTLAIPGSLIGLINYVIIHSAEMPRDALCNVFLGQMTNAKSVIHIH